MVIIVIIVDHLAALEEVRDQLSVPVYVSGCRNQNPEISGE